MVVHDTILIFKVIYFPLWTSKKTSLHTLSTLPGLITMATYDVMEGGGGGGGWGGGKFAPSSAQKTKKSALDRANHYYDNREARGLLLFTTIQIVHMPLVDTLRKASADDFRIYALTPFQATSFNWFP